MESYKFGNKNNWRRWQWNKIMERLNKPPKDAVVVYLIGPCDIRAFIVKTGG